MELNIVIPASGKGSRFAQKGYTLPKPLILVNGVPMIKKVFDNLPTENRQLIIIIQKDHQSKYNIEQTLKEFGGHIVSTDSVTEGAACSILLAESLIDSDTPLLLANSDQYLEWDPEEFLKRAKEEDCDGLISTFRSTDPKFSYAKIDPQTGLVTEVAEKIVISDIATTGIYYWKRGSDFVKYAKEMISKNIRFNNEFYTAPVFNQAILDGKKIKTMDCDKFWSLGTPDDLEYFVENKN